MILDAEIYQSELEKYCGTKTYIIETYRTTLLSFSRGSPFTVSTTRKIVHHRISGSSTHASPGEGREAEPSFVGSFHLGRGLSVIFRMIALKTTRRTRTCAQLYTAGSSRAAWRDVLDDPSRLTMGKPRRSRRILLLLSLCSRPKARILCASHGPASQEPRDSVRAQFDIVLLLVCSSRYRSKASWRERISLGRSDRRIAVPDTPEIVLDSLSSSLLEGSS